MDDGKLNITIKTPEEDFMAFQQLVPERMNRMTSAPDVQVDEEVPCVNRLAEQLHPRVQHLKVEKITQLTPTMKLLRLVPTGETKKLAYFRPGQYLSLNLDIADSRVTRPYSIASSPKDSLAGYYELGIKNSAEGFAAKYLYEQIKEGDELESSAPSGTFYYESIRDRENIIGIAGGSGITPFLSMARAVADGTITPHMTLFYGCNNEKEAAFRAEFLELEKKSGGRLKVVFVLADEEKQGYEHGFVTTNIIEKYADIRNSTLFICGPQPMYAFISEQLKPYGLRRKYVRYELFGQPKNVCEEQGFPTDAVGKTFTLTVHQADETYSIPARTEETLVCSMERAGIRPPTKCRSGSCGFCRSQLVKGDVYVSKKDDGRRYGDIEFGFIHPCSTFPLSDCEIVVPPVK